LNVIMLSARFIGMLNVIMLSAMALRI